MKFGNIFVGKRLFVGCGKPKALGKGETEIRGSAYVEGPLQVGNDKQYKKVEATVMIGEEYNEDALIDLPDTPQDIRRGVDRKMRPCDLSVKVKGNVHIEGDSKTGHTLKINSEAGTAIDINNGTVWIDDQGDAMFKKGTKGMTLSDRFIEANNEPKPFDMVHPSRGEGHRLRYACIEGPEVAVYHRGRLRRGKEIFLPNYWKNLVHINSITVQLQPIGSHQDIIVKRWDDEKIYLQSMGGMPINCFYHVYAERKDINPLITEYEGKDCFDYPDPNFQPDAVNPRFDDPAFSGPPNTITM